RATTITSSHAICRRGITFSGSPMVTQENAEIIRFEGVSKFFGAFQVLKSIDFAAGSGERIVVCGPSGSGKSTLIRCINGLESYDQGTITVDGIRLGGTGAGLRKVRSQVGMVFQQFNLFPHLTVLENLTLGPIRARKMEPARAREVAMRYLERVRI